MKIIRTNKINFNKINLFEILKNRNIVLNEIESLSIEDNKKAKKFFEIMINMGCIVRAINIKTFTIMLDISHARNEIIKEIEKIIKLFKQYINNKIKFFTILEYLKKINIKYSLFIDLEKIKKY